MGNHEGPFYIRRREVVMLANPKGNPQNLDPVRSKKEAKKRGAAGGKKSGETRRKKRDVQQTIKWMFESPAIGPLDKNLQSVGVEEEDRTNLAAIVVGLALKAAQGDTTAFKTLADYGGFNPDKKQRDKESNARIRRMEDGCGLLPAGSGDDEDGDDVIIVLPDNERGDGPKPVQESPESTEDEEEGGDG